MLQHQFFAAFQILQPYGTKRLETILARASITAISACVAINGGNEQECFCLLRLPLLATLDLGYRQWSSNIKLIPPCLLGLIVASKRKQPVPCQQPLKLL